MSRAESSGSPCRYAMQGGPPDPEVACSYDFASRSGALLLRPLAPIPSHSRPLSTTICALCISQVSSSRYLGDGGCCPAGHWPLIPSSRPSYSCICTSTGSISVAAAALIATATSIVAMSQP
eukprot:scaffold580195_cov45-Prasinocladus_malaysianus.AAC.1